MNRFDAYFFGFLSGVLFVVVLMVGIRLVGA